MSTTSTEPVVGPALIGQYMFYTQRAFSATPTKVDDAPTSALLDALARLPRQSIRVHSPTTLTKRIVACETGSIPVRSIISFEHIGAQMMKISTTFLIGCESSILGGLFSMTESTS